MSKKYTVVDLFSGAGGLSLGFLQTQKYDIKVAFENSPYMQETYKRNHPNTEMLGDVCAADYSELKRKYGKIDVIIGGPPCQGFSNANRQKNHVISRNNMLVKQYIRAILELQPNGFVMENVSMLKSDVHRFYLSRSDRKIIRQYEIKTKTMPLCLIEDTYAFRGAESIIKHKDRVEQYLWPESHYMELNVIYKLSKNTPKLVEALEKHRNKLMAIAPAYTANIGSNNYVLRSGAVAFQAITDYFVWGLPADSLQEAIAPAIMTQRMLSIAKEIFDNDIVVDRYTAQNGVYAYIRSYAVYDYLKAILESEKNGYVITSNVLCAADYGAPQKRMRFVVMGVKKEYTEKVSLPDKSFTDKSYRTVKDAIEDLEDVEPVINIEDDTGIYLNAKENLSDLAKQLRDSKILMNHIITNTTEVAMKRFKALQQGQNFHDLDDSLTMNTYTDADRTQNTIYQRLNYNEPSGTVVNVRKSMWIHPIHDRAISIREAARLQTFPDSFVFYGSKDKQYQQVGNAVPPIMAKSIAEKLAFYLSKQIDRDDVDGR